MKRLGLKTSARKKNYKDVPKTDTTKIIKPTPNKIQPKKYRTEKV